MKMRSLVVVIVCCSLLPVSGFVVGGARSSQALGSEPLDWLMPQLMKASHISALSTAIVADDSVVWSRGYGLADRDVGRLAAAESVYLVASISKTLTATAVMQLYEEGLFGLDDDVSAYLGFNLRNPHFPSVPITFRMLLSHHSSLATDPQTDFTRVFPADLVVSGYPDPFFEELLVPGGVHYISQLWSEDEPGTVMHYANLGFGLLGFLVERLSGEPFAQYCHDHIFVPLEMNETSFSLSGLNYSRLVKPYLFYNGEYTAFMQYTMLDYPAGGLRTTVLDLSHFLIMQMNQGVYKDVQLLAPETVVLMHAAQYADHTGYDFNYGLGFQVWEDNESGNQIGHTGGLYGVSTIMAYTEGQDVGVIVFCNKQVITTLDVVEFNLVVRCVNAKARQYLSSDGGLPLPEARSLVQFIPEDYPS